MPMKAVEGNISGSLCKRETVRNQFGENVPTLVQVAELWGYLDMTTEETERAKYGAKLESSTHFFFTDYVPLPENIHQLVMIVKGMTFDVLLCDNVQERNEHWEIYLKLVDTYG